jgi:hypothetical protein
MSAGADPRASSATAQASAGSLPPHRRIFYAGVAVLVAGLIAAVLIYVFSPDDAAARAAAESFNRQHYEFQIERIGGKMMVYLVRFNEWFFRLWQGRQLAFTVGVLAIAVALLCFWLAELVSVPLPRDQDEDRRR